MADSTLPSYDPCTFATIPLSEAHDENELYRYIKYLDSQKSTLRTRIDVFKNNLESTMDVADTFCIITHDCDAPALATRSTDSRLERIKLVEGILRFVVQVRMM